jgi:hypothetical protein
MDLAALTGAVRLHPGTPAAEPALTLRRCPLWREDFSAAEQNAALPEWLAHRWLMEPLRSWLAAHEADPAGHAQCWCERAETPPARRMAEEPEFCARPDWNGAPAETGPWTRAVDPLPLPLHNAWMRLIARLVDVLRLAAPGGRDWLAEGALPLARGEAVAWTEMARGRLPRARAHRMELPPAGRAAQTLASLRGDDAAAPAARAAVAFDPCVEFVVEAAREPVHA